MFVGARELESHLIGQSRAAVHAGHIPVIDRGLPAIGT